MLHIVRGAGRKKWGGGGLSTVMFKCANPMGVGEGEQAKDQREVSGKRRKMRILWNQKVEKKR